MSLKNKIKSNRIVFTGLAALSSLGDDPELILSGIIQKKISVSKQVVKIDNLEWIRFFKHSVKKFSLVDCSFDDELLRDLFRWKRGDVPQDLLYLIALTNKALENGNVRFNGDSNNIGLVLTCEGPGLEHFFKKFLDVSFGLRGSQYDNKLKFIKKVYSKCVNSAYDLQTFMPLYFVSKMNQIHGYSLFVNNACTSGLYAIEAAANIINNGLCEQVVVVGADYADVYKYLWFKENKLYSDDGLIRPFSSNPNGYVFGDGGGAILMESLESALKRKTKIFGEYSGGSFRSQAWKVALPTIKNDEFSKTISNTILKCGFPIQDVSLIFSHGVGVRITDQYEAKAIKSAFGKIYPDVVALKPYVGHNLGGNAILESVIALKCMEHSFVPGTPDYNSFDKSLGLNLVTKSKNKNIKNVLKITTGFAGFEAAVGFKKFTGAK